MRRATARFGRLPGRLLPATVRGPGRTIRLRLTALYGGVFLITGAVAAVDRIPAGAQQRAADTTAFEPAASWSA